MNDEASAERHYKHPSQASSVIEAESELIGVAAEETNALAISGGGIRSASFALGVMQALVNAKVMPRFHYLSTVSGGGYLGSALTWFLHKGLPDGTPAGTDEDNFPFGTRVSSRVAAGGGRNQILDYIRQHASYLVPSASLGMASFIAVALRAMFVSLAAYFGLLTFFMWGLHILRFFDDTVPKLLRVEQVPNLFLLFAIAAAVAFAAMSLLYSLATRVAGTATYGMRTRVQVIFGRTLQAVFVCVLLGSLPFLHRMLGEWVMATSGAASTGLGSLLGLFEFRKQQRDKQPVQPSMLSGVRPVAAAALVLYGLALGAFCLAYIFMDGTPSRGELIAQVCVASTVVFAFVVNINHLGLHRMYRDRLMELFLPDRATIRSGAWALAQEADAASIDRFCQRDGKVVLPYHIINTNVVLVDSPNASYRGRGGDNFILSPLYCGSTATGWRASSHYMKKLGLSPLPTGRGMTLPSAMAISGAAVNPNSGVAGAGTTRSRIVSTLLSILNLRLGYWAPNPRPAQRAYEGDMVPNFIQPGLGGGVFGGGLREDAPLVELSDGGHFENLAVYELIRRRVRCIVVCDGGQDKDFTFSDLSNLTERVRVDFGAKIDFDVEGFGLSGVLPGSLDAASATVIPKAQLAERGFAVGRIRYQGDPRAKPSGTLIYLKGTLTKGLSTDLYGYKNDNPDFPHQSTGDQFFDEGQFEAYRELGYHLGWQFLEANEKHGFWKPPAPSAPPAAAGAGAEQTVSVS